MLSRRRVLTRSPLLTSVRARPRSAATAGRSRCNPDPHQCRLRTLHRFCSPRFLHPIRDAQDLHRPSSHVAPINSESRMSRAVSVVVDENCVAWSVRGVPQSSPTSISPCTCFLYWLIGTREILHSASGTHTRTREPPGRRRSTHSVSREAQGLIRYSVYRIYR